MSWLHTVLGKDGVSQAGVDPKHSALRVTVRPMEVGARGAYSLGAASGVMAAGLAANSEIFQFRWNSPTLNALIQSIRISASVAGTAFAAGAPSFSLSFARIWSADGSGGTTVTPVVNDCKKRTDFAASAVGSVRIASTAALVAGTKVLDSQNITTIHGVSGTATTGQIMLPGTFLWARETPDEYPILLEQNEGVVVRASVPATGTWSFSVTIEWAELDPALVDGWI